MKKKGMKSHQNGGVTGRAPVAKGMSYPVTAKSPASDVRSPSAVHGDFAAPTNY